MEACLGIYIGDKIIKYAKLIRNEKSSRISLYSCGSKYIAGDKESVISEIIEQTGSNKDSLCLNLFDYTRIQSEVFKQLGKADMQSVIELEVADFATSKGLNERNLEYRHIFMDSVSSSDSYIADLSIIEKNKINRYLDNEKYSKLVGLYPIEYVVKNMIQNKSNYVIANIDEKTQLIYVANGKIKQIVDIDVNMKSILETIAEQEGSYSKACDLCRSINVLSDDSISPDIERIIEPTIQDALNRIKAKIDELKIPVQNIYLNGLINLFINIDVLFEQFFGITTEKIKPHFLQLDDSSNASEVIDAADAIALAYQCLENLEPELNFVQGKSKKSAFGEMFAKTKLGKKENSDSKPKLSVMPNVSKENLEKSLLFANLTAGAVLVGYVGFGAAYNAQMTKIEQDLTSNINKFKMETSEIAADVRYINTNKEEYVSLNNYVSDTVNKIKEGKIGKYTTYNVANFMQKVAKYIPSNVELQKISSNNNKTVSVVAKSSSYAELGYFIAQLKLKGILENVKVTNVENGEYAIVTIGGELP